MKIKKNYEKRIEAIFKTQSVEEIEGSTVYVIYGEPFYDCMDYGGDIGKVVMAKIAKADSGNIKIIDQNGKSKVVTTECFAREFSLYWFLDKDAAQEACDTRGFLPWHKNPIKDEEREV